MGVSAEKVGHRAARMMRNFLDTGVAAGHHLAHQLLLPMALAGGGRLTTFTPDNHLRNNIGVIEAFLPIRIQVEKSSSSSWLVTLPSINHAWIKNRPAAHGCPLTWICIASITIPNGVFLLGTRAICLK